MTASATQKASGHATPQLDQWSGDFGDQYVDRNAVSEDAVRMRTRVWSKLLEPMRGDKPETILECGCNVGLNQRGLRNVTGAELFAVEPNAKARDQVLRDGVLDDAHLFDAHLGGRLPFEDASIDLVFTSGVLIHVPPSDLEAACAEIFRVSRKYVLAVEYFSARPETISYRGHDELLFKRDFGGFWLDLYPELTPVDEGFFWNRTTGFDDATWWLFKKA